MSERPLFIPLKGTYYHQFRTGEKDTEYRKYGVRWNYTTCRVGRPVLLSLGYAARHPRLRGVIVGFSLRRDVGAIPGWGDCYGDTPATAACIKIKLE